MSTKSLRQLSTAGSMSRRREAFEALMGLSGMAFCRAALEVLESPYRDLCEWTLELCHPNEAAEEGLWMEAIEERLGEDMGPQFCQNLLVLLGRIEQTLTPRLVEFYRAYLGSPNADLRYQAFCIAELQSETGEAYLEELRKLVRVDDEDLRIVLTQALSRLKPEWALETLEEMARYARGQESFHILLAKSSFQAQLSAEDEAELLRYIYDDRYSYPSLLALGDCGSRQSIEPLLHFARGLFVEPSLRVAAAHAAAKLGSEEAIRELEKLSKDLRGNPCYASKALHELRARKLGGKSQELSAHPCKAPSERE